MLNVESRWYCDQLNKNDINIWIIELHKLGFKLNSHWNILSADEKEKALLFKSSQLQSRYVTARGGLRRLLGLYINIHPAEITFAYNSQGKPNIDNHKGIFFNLTHSKDLALIAISKVAEVGIDLEFIDAGIDLISLSKLVMTSEEEAMFFNEKKRKLSDLFYTIWTRKEAFLKGLGLGLQVDLKKCFVGLDSSPQLKIYHFPEINSDEWSLRDIHLRDSSYKAAVALRKNVILNYRMYYYH